jgi:hypothetical protein
VSVMSALFRSFVHRLGFPAFARWILRSKAAAVWSRRMRSLAATTSRSRAFFLSVLRFNDIWRSLHQSMTLQSPVHVPIMIYENTAPALGQGPTVPEVLRAATPGRRKTEEAA